MASDPTDQAVEAKKKSPLVLIIVIVNVLAIAGAAAFFLLKPGDADAKEGAAAAAAAPVMTSTGMMAMPIDPETFTTVDMLPYIVNLREDGGTRYLKIAITLRLRAPEAADPFRKVQKAVRDAYISYLTDLTLEDLSGSDHKAALKKALVQKANETLGRMEVIDVYFTEFVVQ